MSNIDHPSHYNSGKIETIDVIEDWNLGFHEGNVVKYVSRAKHKSEELEDLEDLKKAAWYLERRIRQLEPIGLISLDVPASKLTEVGVNEMRIESTYDGFRGFAEITAMGMPEDIRELFDALDRVIRR